MNEAENEYFRIIRRAAENNKLSVFVGSAVSYDSNLPSWSKLVEEMDKSLGNKTTGNNLKTAEQYFLQFGNHAYYSKINEYFPSNSRPNDVHRLILSLKPQYIVTTNWDDLLEKAIEEKAEPYFPVATDHQLASSPTSRLLIKMHGDLSHRNIVFKESDYLSYSENFPLIENFIKSIFSTNVVIFIGYSINDYNLNQILSWVKNRTSDSPPIFTISTSENVGISEQNYLKSKGVFTILGRSISEEDKIKHKGLSTKSISTAKILDEISVGEKHDDKGALEYIKSCLADWEAVSPLSFVQLVKDAKRINSTNKIYYEPSTNCIVYWLENEFPISRSKYRELRKELKLIIKKIPIFEFRLFKDYEIFLSVKNPTKFTILNEYTRFDFKGKNTGLESSVSISMDDHETLYSMAYDSYFTNSLDHARDVFLRLSILYYSNSKFIKSIICAYNARHLLYGRMPLEIYDKISDAISEDQLSINDRITELLDKLPRGLIARQKPLINGLDYENNIALGLFKKLSDICKKLYDDLEWVKQGKMISSTHRESIINYLNWIIIFFNKNKIVSIHNTHYKSILGMGFESILKRFSYTKDFEIDIPLAYSAIISHSEIQKLLSSYLNKDSYIKANNETVDYLFDVLTNIISSAEKFPKRSIREFFFGYWSNAITIASYIRLDEAQIERASTILHKAIKLHDETKIFDSINIFLVNQINLFGQTINSITIHSLLKEQIKIICNAGPREILNTQKLFNNTVAIIGKSSDTTNLGDEQPFLDFIFTVSNKKLKDRLQLIDRFVFTLHSLSTGKIKRSIEQMLKKTFNESKKFDFTLDSVIFGLNLKLLGLVKSQDDIRFIMNKLDYAIRARQNTISSAFFTIHEQLLNIGEDIPEEYATTKQEVSNLVEQLNKFYSKNNF